MLWPSFLQLHRAVREEDVDEKKLVKVKKVQKQGYITSGEAKILTHYLSVPKGEDI